MKNLILLCSLILLFNACQVAELPQNPENDPQTVTVFALTGSTVAMDLQSVERFKNAKYFQITKQPANGSVGFVKEKMLLYVSDANANVRNTYFLLKSSSDDSLTNKPVLDTVRIHFTNIDSIPCTNGTLADYYTLQPNQSLLMNVLINDSFCSGTLDSTSLSIAVEPKNGTVSIENTSTSTKIRYTPIPNFAGIDQLVYKVCDKQGNCSLGTVQIAGQRSNSNCESVFQNDDFYYNIKPANDTIYTKGVKISVLENDRICYVNGYDYENKILVAPANGTAVFVGSLLIYTPKIGFKGTDAIDYTVCEVSPNLTNCLGKAKIFIKID